MKILTQQQVRIEKDSMGEVAVPVDALYGAQTQRAIENFPISGLHMPRDFIRALGMIKLAAAQVNVDLKLLDRNIGTAIISAAQEVVDGQHDNQFLVDVFQTGSGTSSNMNANEVIATIASHIAQQRVHPNDQVNMGQSSNDVIPACIHVSCSLASKELLIPALKHLLQTIQLRAQELQHVTKTGRTHLMDAMPVTFGQELSGWAAQLGLALHNIEHSVLNLHKLQLGGTAVGTGVNTHPKFSKMICKQLSGMSGIDFTPMSNFFAGLSGQDAAVEFSGQLRNLAVILMKISNDLRLMNSGPLAGLSEIALPDLQPGSSIMPGKVNPVIPEAMAMIAAQVMGNDAAIAIGGQSGNFQLNVMLPMIAYNLLQSVEILANGMRLLADKAIAGFKVNYEVVELQLAKNPILVTALNSIIGYELGAKIAKQSYAQKRQVIEVAKELTNLSEDELHKLLDPRHLTQHKE